MSENKALIRMHLLQLQQLSAVMALSEKINWVLRKVGVPEESIDEICKQENNLHDIIFKGMFDDWKPDLMELTGIDHDISAEQLLKQLRSIKSNS